MLQKSPVLDGLLARLVQQGDTLCAGEFDASLATVGAGTILAQHIASGYLNRTGVTGGGFADTLDTVANMMAALLNPNNNGIQAGTSFKFRYKNNGTTQTATITASTGWTLSGTMTVATAAWRDFLVTIQNSTPAQIQSGSTTNTSPIVLLNNVAGVAPATSTITPGAAISGTGIPAATTVLSVQPGVGVTMSANATATNNPVALTFGPTATLTNEGGGTI